MRRSAGEQRAKRAADEGRIIGESDSDHADAKPDDFGVERAQLLDVEPRRLDIDAADVATRATPDQLLAIDDALAKLAPEDAAAARLVELRYFGGLTVEEAGKALGISTATAYRHWKNARAWLHNELLGAVEP